MKATRSVIVVLVLSGLCACETVKAIPDGYAGPTAVLRDSTTAVPGGSCGDIYFLNGYEGKSINNLYAASYRANEGAGLNFRSVPQVSRPLPIQLLHLEIVGRTYCAAPIMELSGKSHIVYGIVEFTPQANGEYVIKGELAEDHSAVWIADAKTGAQVSTKLLINGPAKQGAFGKTGNVERIAPPTQ